MKKATIEVPTTQGPKELAGYLVGSYLLVHRTMSTGLDHWNLTHVPTGLGLGIKRATRKRAALVAEAILRDVASTWGGEEPLNQSDRVGATAILRPAWENHRYDHADAATTRRG